MRIYFYGVQGSGSTFPSFAERSEYRKRLDCVLLRRVFEDFERHLSADRKAHVRIEDVLGGSLNTDSLEKYRDELNLTELPVYGGWTTCVRIETSDGFDIVLDCGSGFRTCAHDLQKKWGAQTNRNLFVFGSHSHLDHTEGFDQAAVCFDPRNTISVYGNRQFLQALDVNLGIFSHRIEPSIKGVQTPMAFDLMPATFKSHAIQDAATAFDANDKVVHHYHDQSRPVEIGKTKITAFDVDHPAPCLAYRIEHNEKVFVFCTDHEL